MCRKQAVSQAHQEMKFQKIAFQRELDTGRVRVIPRVTGAYCESIVLVILKGYTRCDIDQTSDEPFNNLPQ